MQRKPIANSSNIVSAGYSDGTAIVEFKNGSVYTTSDVTEKEWEAFEKTFDDKDVSTGSHYHRNLKDKNWEKLGDE